MLTYPIQESGTVEIPKQNLQIQGGMFILFNLDDNY